MTIRKTSLRWSAAALALLCASPAWSMTGQTRAPSDAVVQAVTLITGSRGTFCTATVIAPTLLLTAAHCLMPGASYKRLTYGRDGTPELHDIARILAHPQFSAQALAGHRATADVALALLAAPAKAKPLPIGVPDDLAAGSHFIVAGGGVTQRGDGRTGGTLRAAELVATGKPGTLQIRLVDPATNGATPGQGACTGDSGAPAFQMKDNAPVVIGVVSWSTGAKADAGCGGMTGITPLTLYRDWIVSTAKAWGVTLQ